MEPISTYGVKHMADVFSTMMTAGISLAGILGAIRNIAAFVVVFGLLVFFHELGHFLAAKWSGVRVHEFALGFGPSLFSKRLGETMYSIRIFPLGGFVRLAGMEPSEEPGGEDGAGTEDDERAFYRRPALHRIGILAAGPFMNFVLAAIVYTIILGGLVVTIDRVIPNSPAETAGLQAGDRLVSVGGLRVLTMQEVLDGVRQAQGGPVTIVVERNDKKETVVVQPEINPETGVPMIGIEFRMDVGSTRRPFGEAVVAGLLQTWNTTVEYVRSVGRMIVGAEERQVAGPIGIFQMTGQFAAGGITSLLTLVGLLSIALAVFNLLPIPILDGGGIMFVLVEAVRGRPLAPEHKGIAQLIGLSLLLLLLLFATFQDLGRLRTGLDAQTSMHVEKAEDWQRLALEIAAGESMFQRRSS